MKRVLIPLSALVGAGLLLAASMVLAETDGSVPLGDRSAQTKTVQPVVDASDEDPAVRVRDPLLAVNKDGSAAIGAYLQNEKDFEVSLVGVVVRVYRHRVLVNATEMWLPVPAGERSQVGAASDAGGFVVPSGISDGSRAEVEFHFDDGTCVLADVTAVARTSEHRLIYPKSNRSIGPVTSDEPPAESAACSTD